MTEADPFSARSHLHSNMEVAAQEASQGAVEDERVRDDGELNVLYAMRLGHNCALDSLVQTFGEPLMKIREDVRERKSKSMGNLKGL